MATGTIKKNIFLKATLYDLSISGGAISAGSFKDIDTGITFDSSTAVGVDANNNPIPVIVPIYFGGPRLILTNTWLNNGHIIVTVLNSGSATNDCNKQKFVLLTKE